MIIGVARVTVYAHEVSDPIHSEENTVNLTEKQIQKLGLITQIAAPGQLSSQLSLRGKIILHPDRLARIIPKVSGIVREVRKNMGDSVKIGEIMAVLESREMADMKASFLAALSKMRLAESNLEREKRLYREKISPGQDFLIAQNVYEEAVINVQLTRQKLRAFGLNDREIEMLAHQKDPDLRFDAIRSPLDGVVIMRHITKGEYIENTSPIYEVANLNPVWVEIGIYPKDLFRVKEGQTVEVLLPSENKRAPARLIYVSPIVAEETITSKAIAELNNSDGTWPPGVFVNVNIALETNSFPILIAKDAVQQIEGKDVVFVVTPAGFEKRFVVLGQRDYQNVEVISGLHEGERYVANKSFLLKAELGKYNVEHEH